MFGETTPPIMSLLVLLHWLSQKRYNTYVHATCSLIVHVCRWCYADNKKCTRVRVSTDGQRLTRAWRKHPGELVVLVYLLYSGCLVVGQNMGRDPRLRLGLALFFDDVRLKLDSPLVVVLLLLSKGGPAVCLNLSRPDLGLALSSMMFA